jgi:hypothetical protein
MNLVIKRQASRRPLAQALVALAGGAAAVLLVGRTAQAALPSEQDVRAAVKAILSKPDYLPPQPGLSDRFSWLLGKILEWILRPIGWVIDKLSKLGPEGSPTAHWLVVGLLLAVLVLVVAHIYYTSASAFRTGRKRGAAAGKALDLSADPVDILARAKIFADRGDYRTAVSLLYQAALLRLDRAGLIRFYPSRTNWQYADVVEERADLAAPFRRLTLVADRAMYSTAPVEERHFAEASAALGEVEGALR